MRSALIAGAFAVGALAVPYQKRDMVTDVDMVYVTAVVTVTAGQDAPAAAYSTPTSAPAPAGPPAKVEHWGHHGHGGDDWPASSEAPPAPAPAPTTSEYVAPAPQPTETSTWEYVAPVTTSASEYVAPAPEPTEEAAPATQEAAAAPSSAAAAPSSYDAPSATYQDKVLHHHNIHRQNHSVPDLEWDDGLALTAQLIAQSCIYAHNTDINSDDANGGGYGQNIAAGVDADHVGNVITDMFYNGEVNAFEPYYGKPDTEVLDYEVWGHFSQMVWKATNKVGCYTQNCPAGLKNGPGNDFTVCNYRNTGNVFGNYGNVLGNEFKSNVLPPKKNPTVYAGN